MTFSFFLLADLAVMASPFALPDASLLLAADFAVVNDEDDIAVAVVAVDAVVVVFCFCMNLNRRWDGLLVLFGCDCVVIGGVAVAVVIALFDACETLS